MVRLELWNGVGSSHDREALEALGKALPELPMTQDVWKEAYALADQCRVSGYTAPVQDVLIAACARVHGVDLEHEDKHYDWLMKIQGLQ